MSPRRQSVEHQTTIQIQGQAVVVIIRAMKRKSLRLGITEDGEVEVKVPLGCPKHELMAFLNRHTGWLEQRLDLFWKKRAANKNSMRYLGEQYRFCPSEQKSKQPVFITDVCYYPNTWQDDDILANIELWQREQAKIVFQQLIDRWWPHFSHGALIDNPTLRVKKMRTRWGSLSSKGYINLNLKLLEMTPDIIEMVVVHELCHSHFFDHSANFYALMAEKLPHYKVLENKLKHIEKGVEY